MGQRGTLALCAQWLHERCSKNRIFAGLVLIGIGAVIGWLWAPGLWSDWTVRNEPLTEVTDIRVVNGGKCRSTARVIWTCNIRIAPRDPRDRSFDEKFQYAIFGLETDQTLRVMRTSAGPSVYTTDIGLKFLMNRIAVFVSVVGGFSIFGLWSLRKGLRGE
jgi:hypothetical protein